MPFTAKEKVINKVIEVETAKIMPNPYQPRKNFGDDIFGLAESIKENGILQPLTVRKQDDTYILIAGERRLRASKLAGLSTVPCIVIDMTERNSALMALLENIQRKDLSFFDEAEAIEQLLDFYGMTQEDAAARLGKSQSSIANKLRLLKLDKDLRKKINDYGLTERHARALLKLTDKQQQEDMVENIYLKRLNVEQTERAIDCLIAKNAEFESIRRRSGAFKDVRLFVNTINKAIEMMQAAGINANSQKIQKKDYIEYIVHIPTQ
ncbi:MAG: ParB/RepB/Spo0J family partition protein [Huintestinicola sp.]